MNLGVHFCEFQDFRDSPNMEREMRVIIHNFPLSNTIF